ncbi:MAG TPA: ferritin-like domain-containing protein, partial [Myxococcota bacterium]|nr:ferritin-like domain-containing protein [Myxococcota bacterium]
MTGVGARLELDEGALDRGGHLLLKRALADLAPGVRLEVRGRAPALVTHLRTWCRQQGHRLEEGECLVVVRGGADRDRWHGARRAGGADRQEVVESPAATWGLAARSALVESGGPRFHFPLDEKVGVWADVAGDLYRQALRAQWDPDEVIPWAAPLSHPDEVEDALVQVLTYLIENETAALLVPARFAAQTHPHFREVMQLLAIQAADEARHVEVFTRRALLRRKELGRSSAGGQASLQTLVEEPDFELASFLLSVLGEGTFLNLLAFLRRVAPDACTAEIMRLAAADEARHVAFGMAHLLHRAERDPGLLGRLASAIERRHSALEQTAGLNE